MSGSTFFHLFSRTRIHSLAIVSSYPRTLVDLWCRRANLCLSSQWACLHTQHTLIKAHIVAKTIFQVLNWKSQRRARLVARRTCSCKWTLFLSLLGCLALFFGSSTLKFDNPTHVVLQMLNNGRLEGKVTASRCETCYTCLVQRP